MDFYDINLAKSLGGGGDTPSEEQFFIVNYSCDLDSQYLSISNEECDTSFSDIKTAYDNYIAGTGKPLYVLVKVHDTRVDTTTTFNILQYLVFYDSNNDEYRFDGNTVAIFYQSGNYLQLTTYIMHDHESITIGIRMGN